MNRVALIGRLTKNPELRYTPNGIATVTITVAVDRLPDKDGNKKTDFINVVVWNKQAENVNKYMIKGGLIAIEGRIQTRTYDDKNGQKRYITEVLSERVQFLDNRKKTDDTKLSTEQVDNTPIENDAFDDGFEVPW